MFGVLLVQNKHNEIGYLAAFSGKLAGQNHLPKFVPPVFDMLSKDSFFLTQKIEINKINKQLEQRERNPQILELEEFLQFEIDASARQQTRHREKIIAGRKRRKAQRAAAEIELNANDLLKLKEQLGQESIKEKLQLRDLNIYWSERIQQAEKELKQLTNEITSLKKQRKELSAALQKQLFDQYQFLNIKGKLKSLRDIFQETTQITPPAGAGECATPKLLHYAFAHNFQPLAMAEFWWGASPKSEIRKHQNFYPACQGKCQPILEHMLEGISMDDNPLLTNPAQGKSIDIIYQDEVMLVINKPAEFLSVPGKNIEDSVYLRIKQSFPKAMGPLIIHRLDMATSGLMVIALSKEAHKELQKQFIKRTVKKRYVALLAELRIAGVLLKLCIYLKVH
jgi:tRNA pseudouridine32 synthase/23S rRNA pseudouridine746 synthase